MSRSTRNVKAAARRPEIAAYDSLTADEKMWLQTAAGTTAYGCRLIKGGGADTLADEADAFAMLVECNMREEVPNGVFDRLTDRKISMALAGLVLKMRAQIALCS